MPRWLRRLLLALAGLTSLSLVAFGLRAWGMKEQWDTGTAVGVAGLAVAVFGFGLAINESRRARSVAGATKTAVEHTLKGVAAIQIVRMIEQLRQAVADLEEAMHDEDPAGIRLAIRTWRTVAVDVTGPIERRFGDRVPALETLEKSIEAARKAAGALRKGKRAQEVAPSCVAALERAVDQLGPLREQLLPTIGELDEHA